MIFVTVLCGIGFGYIMGQVNGYNKRCDEVDQENEFWKEIEKHGL